MLTIDAINLPLSLPLSLSRSRSKAGGLRAEGILLHLEKTVEGVPAACMHASRLLYTYHVIYIYHLEQTVEGLGVRV